MTPQRRIFTPQEKAYISKAYKRGHTIEAISRGLRCGKDRVRAYLNSVGIPRRSQQCRSPILPPLAPFGSYTKAWREQQKRTAERKVEMASDWNAPQYPGWRVHGELWIVSGSGRRAA